MICLFIFSLAGCIYQADMPPDSVMEVRPGVYKAQIPGDVPLPMSDYDIYVIGELYGAMEVTPFILEYLQSLHDAQGVCTIIIEHDRVYQMEANDYVQGKTDSLCEALCLRKDVLNGLKSYNETLPEEEKISVYFIDIDSTLDAIYLHLQRILNTYGPPDSLMGLPPVCEIETWNHEKAMEFFDQLQTLSADPAFLNQLETIRASLQIYLSKDKGKNGNMLLFPSVLYTREQVYTQNMAWILHEVSSPLLAVVGSIHAQKTPSFYDEHLHEFKTWVQRLTEEGIPIHSVGISGVTGKIHWLGGVHQVSSNLMYLKYSDGTLLTTLWTERSFYHTLYVDLRRKENASLLWSGPDRDVLLCQVYDGIIYFHKITPMNFDCSS